MARFNPATTSAEYAIILLMATFANVGFNVANYASFRPTYPLGLYRYILSHYVAGTQGKSTKGIRNGVALDIGCGTGQVTKILPKLGFTNVIGTDPSAKMIDQANNELQTNEKEIRYMISKAEEVDAVLPPHSVDLITAGKHPSPFGPHVPQTSIFAPRSSSTLV
ncbi:hypothetical protein FRC02_012063 [Tulasnella sp. 418]|nr:hypothetical protein FRC02_012063 [Tulasnella sp. 418]